MTDDYMPLVFAEIVVDGAEQSHYYWSQIPRIGEHILVKGLFLEVAALLWDQQNISPEERDEARGYGYSYIKPEQKSLSYQRVRIFCAPISRDLWNLKVGRMAAKI